MIFDWFKNRRRKGLWEQPFPAPWIEFLQKNVRHYAHLEPRLQNVLQQVVQVFVVEKHWAGAAGLAVSDEMKVTVAGQAGLLVLGLEEPYFFDRVPSVILYPRNFRRPGMIQRDSWIIQENWRLSGEAWYRGPIVLSWEDVQASGRNAARGRNVTLHEFAHHLDGLDGAVDGVPPLAADQEQKWCRVAEAEYLRLVGSTQRQEATLLDQYGATNRIEFFAVATECFFEQPHEMRRLHRELYEILRDFYRQDPAAWLPDAKGSRDRRPAKQEDQSVAIEADGPADEEVPEWYIRQLAPQGPEKLFLLGMEYLEHEQNRAAAEVFSLIIDADRSDAEAYLYRATARQRLGEHAAALADAEEALRLDPDDEEAFRVRGAVRLGLGELQKAKQDLDRALAGTSNDAEAYYLRGLTLLGLDKLRPAISDLSWSITLRPHAAKAYYHRAHALRRLGDTEKADADLEKAMQLDPHVAWRE